MDYTNCNLCGKNNTRALFRIKERLLGKEDFNIVKCTKCGLLYTNPRPTPKEMECYYPENYEPYKFTVPKLLFRKEKGFFNKTKYFIKKKLLNVHYDYFENLSNTKIIDKILRIVTLPIIYYVSWLFPQWKKNGKTLDIGCSTGTYLYHLKELGWETYGVELNKKVAFWAKEKLKLNVFNGNLEDASFPSNYFDAITLFSTFEHLYDPMKTLKEVHRILKKDGIIMIEVPVFLSFESGLFKSFWSAWEVPRHLYHFTPATLKKMLIKEHFQIIKVQHLPYINILLSSIENLFLKIFPKKKNFIKNFFNTDTNRILL